MPETIIAAGGLVTNDNNELLMIFRRGKWDLPKGKLDEGETLEECAVREVEEETGLRHVQLGKPLGITYHAYFDPYLKKDVIKESHWYAMTVSGEQQLVPQTAEDIVEITWADDAAINKYLENSYPNIVEIIHTYRSNRHL